jgi:hypothetical protein
MRVAPPGERERNKARPISARLAPGPKKGVRPIGALYTPLYLACGFVLIVLSVNYITMLALGK